MFFYVVYIPIGFMNIFPYVYRYIFISVRIAKLPHLCGYLATAWRVNPPLLAAELLTIFKKIMCPCQTLHALTCA